LLGDRRTILSGLCVKLFFATAALVLLPHASVFLPGRIGIAIIKRKMTRATRASSVDAVRRRPFMRRFSEKPVHAEGSLARGRIHRAAAARKQIGEQK
jgi:hypothetical protein